LQIIEGANLWMRDIAHSQQWKISVFRRMVGIGGAWAAAIPAEDVTVGKLAMAGRSSA